MEASILPVGTGVMYALVQGVKTRLVTQRVGASPTLFKGMLFGILIEVMVVGVILICVSAVAN